MYTLRTHPIEYLFADRIAHVCAHTHTHFELYCYGGPSPYSTYPLFCAHMLSHVQLFCDSMDCSLQGSSVHGIFHPRILGCRFLLRGSSQCRDQTRISYICPVRQILHHGTTWEAPYLGTLYSDRTVLQMNMKINLLGPFYTLSIKIYIIWQDVKEYKHLINQKHFLSSQSQQSWCLIETIQV